MPGNSWLPHLLTFRRIPAQSKISGYFIQERIPDVLSLHQTQRFLGAGHGYIKQAALFFQRIFGPAAIQYDQMRKLYAFDGVDGR